MSAEDGVPPTSRQVRGHGLIREGLGWMVEADHTGRTRWVVDDRGRGRCTCGATSDHLPSNAARKRWHRQHKGDVLAALGGF